MLTSAKSIRYIPPARTGEFLSIARLKTGVSRLNLGESNHERGEEQTHANLHSRCQCIEDT